MEYKAAQSLISVSSALFFQKLARPPGFLFFNNIYFLIDLNINFYYDLCMSFTIYFPRYLITY